MLAVQHLSVLSPSKGLSYLRYSPCMHQATQQSEHTVKTCII